jgi:chromosome segregation and condensation protein ScpB
LSIALLNEVEGLKRRVESLEFSREQAVTLADLAELIRENRELKERVEALERKAAKRG